MKPGQLIQIKRHGHWIFARVLSVNKDGSALVAVQHAGNVDHGQKLLVQSDEVRTSDDLSKLVQLAQKGTTAQLAAEDGWIHRLDHTRIKKSDLVQHYQAQLDALNEEAAQ